MVYNVLTQLHDSSAKTVHMEIHTGERPLKCKHCDFSFHSLNNLRRHESTYKSKKTKKILMACMLRYLFNACCLLKCTIYTSKVVSQIWLPEFNYGCLILKSIYLINNV